LLLATLSDLIASLLLLATQVDWGIQIRGFQLA